MKFPVYFLFFLISQEKIIKQKLLEMVKVTIPKKNILII